jgi:hypothetical protein
MDRLDEYKKFLRENNKCNSLREVEKFEIGHNCKKMEDEINNFVNKIIKNIPRIRDLTLREEMDECHMHERIDGTPYLGKKRYIIEVTYLVPG